VASLTGAWVTAAVISTAAALIFKVLHIDPGTTKLEFMLVICTHMQILLKTGTVTWMNIELNCLICGVIYASKTSS